MFKIIAVTNRNLCKGGIDGLGERIRALSQAGVHSIILREKDLTLAEYKELAKTALRMIQGTNTILIAHSFIEVAKELGIKNIHLPLNVLRQNQSAIKYFDAVGVSVHSLNDAEEAVLSGANYLIAGHIFETDCKANLAPRGLTFLNELKNKCSLPIYAIGGITGQNIASVKQSGVSGACLMSSLMQTEDITSYLKNLKLLCRHDP